jgi:hypothetical protein
MRYTLGATLFVTGCCIVALMDLSFLLFIIFEDLA